MEPNGKLFEDKIEHAQRSKKDSWAEQAETNWAGPSEHCRSEQTEPNMIVSIWFEQKVDLRGMSRSNWSGMKESKKKRVGEEWREQIGAYRSKKSVMEREIIEDRSEKIRANWSGQIILEKESRNKENKVERSKQILEERN